MVGRAHHEGLPVAHFVKIQHPDRESEFEADALRLWAGDGAVRLIANDPERRAGDAPFQHERAPLSAEPLDVALDVLIGLLPRIWKPAGVPFTSLTDEAARWAVDLPATWERAGQPFEQELLDLALDLLATLPSSQGEQVLVHQDLHADNVLAAEREPWLVIDPKPLIGERELALAPIIRSSELGHSRQAVVHRLVRLTSELGLDRERACGWAITQTLAWSFEGDVVLPRHLDVARWLASSF
jgi:streptomycin 6-kinase